MGNWTEERALKEKTGTNRFESWATQGPEEMSQSIYATKAVAPSMPTFPGVIEHNDALVGVVYVCLCHFFMCLLCIGAHAMGSRCLLLTTPLTCADNPLITPTLRTPLLVFQAPQDWESVYKRSYVDSKSADAYPSFIEYKDKSSLGPREKRVSGL